MKKNIRIEVLGQAGIPGLREHGIGCESFRDYRGQGQHVHTHDIVELIYICSGRGKHLLGHREQPVGPGSLTVIHYNQAHRLVSGDQGMDLINLYLDLRRYTLPVLSPELNRILPGMIPMHPRVGHRLRTIVHLQFDEPRRIQRILEDIIRELSEGKPGYLDATRSSLSLFLTACCRHYTEQKEGARRKTINKPRPDHLIDRVERLRQHMDTHYQVAMTLDDLARLASLQKNYLCRVFKQHTGQTLFHYLMNRRLEQALLLLRQTNRKIIDVAHDSGFHDLPHFNRVFKREIGLSPRAYRQQGG